MKSLLLILALALAGCNAQTKKVNEIQTRIDSGGCQADLISVDHDGHKFILMLGSSRGGIIHHPSCRCHQAKLESEVEK